MRKLSVLLLCLCLSGCHGGYKTHPGAPSTEASVAYDTLLSAQAVIDSARQQYEQGALPESSESYLQTLINAYNVAIDSFSVYIDALDTHSSNLQEATARLTADIARVESSIIEFRKAGQK